MTNDIHDTKTQETADNDLHALAEGGIPQHGDRVQGEEVVHKHIGDHAKVANACAAVGSSVAGSTRGGAQIHCKESCDEGPDDNGNDGNDQSGLAPKTAGEAVQNQSNCNLDDTRGNVQSVLVGSIVL